MGSKRLPCTVTVPSARLPTDGCLAARGCADCREGVNGWRGVEVFGQAVGVYLHCCRVARDGQVGFTNASKARSRFDRRAMILLYKNLGR